MAPLAKEDMSSSPEPETPASPQTKKRKAELNEIEVDLAQPEPPSKKAKRLLKKGKKLPVKPSSDDEAEPKDGLDVPAGKDGNKKKGADRSEFSIWIGNLAYSMTRPELFNWFIENSGGLIKEENITRVNLPTTKTPAGYGRPAGVQNKGFAYVDFDTEAAAIAAMSLTETELNRRNVLIKKASNFEGRPKKEAVDAAGEDAGGKATSGAAAPRNANASRKIYVGNLGFQTTEDDLRHHFEKCGEIEWVKVATFEDSGKCKGYGWVKFKEVEAAEWAVKGFVRVKEEIETEDDFNESKSDDENDEEEEGKKKEKKFQMRKWWVNRLRGRQLKVEFAEDDQSRYKKRFGKDAPGKKQGGEGQAERPAREPRAPREDRKPKPDRQAYGDAQVATYLTGGIVKAEGKKTTFD